MGRRGYPAELRRKVLDQQKTSWPRTTCASWPVTAWPLLSGWRPTSERRTRRV